MFMPTGDRARGLRMIELAETGQSPKAEDFRTLAMTINVVFEGRWEEGLPQALRLQEDYPAYARMVLPLSAMRLLAPGLGDDLTARIEVSEAVVASRPLEEVDIASVWMSRTYTAWIDRLLLGPAQAEKGFAAIVAAAPTEPDWVADFAARQLEELAADRADGVPDELVAAVWTVPVDSLAQVVSELEKLADSSLRAAFFAAEGHLRMNDTAKAERLYRKVATSDGPDHLEPFRMVASARVGEIKALTGNYRSASRWYERAVESPPRCLPGGLDAQGPGPALRRDEPGWGSVVRRADPVYGALVPACPTLTEASWARLGGPKTRGVEPSGIQCNNFRKNAEPRGLRDGPGLDLAICTAVGDHVLTAVQHMRYREKSELPYAFDLRSEKFLQQIIATGR